MNEREQQLAEKWWMSFMNASAKARDLEPEFFSPANQTDIPKEKYTILVENLTCIVNMLNKKICGPDYHAI